MIKLLLVDDAPHVRQMLRLRLALEPDLAVIGEASEGEEAVVLAQALHPDVVLMDVRMEHMDGITAANALRAASPEIAVVMFSLHDDPSIRARAQAAGARAFVAKQDVVTHLVDTIREAGSAGSVVSKR